MKKTAVKLVVSVIAVFGVCSANAELFINPVVKNSPGSSEISAHFGTSSVDYEYGGSSSDIDRTFIGATYAQGLNSSIDVYGTFSLTLESELEFTTTDGDGFILGGGVRGLIPNDMGVSLHGYGQFLLIDEDYGTSVDGEEMSIMLGLVASKALDSKIKIYGGAEFNLFSDMDIGNVDADRDDFLGARLGLNFDLGAYLLNANLSLIHETGLFISASRKM